VEIPIIGTNMRLPTNMMYNEEGLGVNIQHITQPFEVLQSPQFASLGYTKGEWSRVSDASEILLRPSRKENYGNTSPSSHGSMHCRERAKESSCSHEHTRDQKERYNQSQYLNVHFNYNHVVNDVHKSWHKRTWSFCGLHNHMFIECWKIIAVWKKMRHEIPFEQQAKKKVKKI